MRQLRRIAVGLAVAVLLFGAKPVTALDAQDFVMKSFTADYRLARDQNKVSQLYVREKIVAQFPDYDQNHGILRAIPESYQGHTVELEITGVQHEDATPYTYETSTDHGNMVLKIGNANKYVHGAQTYIIDYAM